MNSFTEKYTKSVKVLTASFILILALVAKQAEASEASERCNRMATTYMTIKEGAEAGVDPWVFVKKLMDRGLPFDLASETVSLTYATSMSPEELGYKAFILCMKEEGEAV